MLLPLLHFTKMLKIILKVYLSIYLGRWTFCKETRQDKTQRVFLFLLSHYPKPNIFPFHLWILPFSYFIITPEFYFFSHIAYLVELFLSLLCTHDTICITMYDNIYLCGSVWCSIILCLWRLAGNAIPLPIHAIIIVFISYVLLWLCTFITLYLFLLCTSLAGIKMEMFSINARITCNNTYIHTVCIHICILNVRKEQDQDLWLPSTNPYNNDFLHYFMLLHALTIPMAWPAIS